MAFPTARSCNTDLRLGMVDGKVKQYAMNRGGVVEGTTAPIRQKMSGAWHGFNMPRNACLPNGEEFTLPNYYDITPEDEENI